MVRRKFPIFILLSAVLILMVSCAPAKITKAEDSDASHGEVSEDEASHSDDGHHEGAMDMPHMHVEAPAKFAALTNPFAGNDESIEAGAEIFQTNCASCHGPEGQGDGPAAENLDPKPAMLADGTMMNDLSDGYLFWRISEGGQMEPFNSAMPSWKTALTEQERWQVVSFVRTLASGEGEHAHDKADHMDDDHAEDAHAVTGSVDDDTEMGEHMDDGHMDDEH